MPSLSDERIRARLKKIAALVGDGHTGVRLSPEGEPRRTLPVHMFLFKEGLYVIGASPACSELVGTRIVRIGDLDAPAALAAVRAYTSVDNEMGHAADGPVVDFGIFGTICAVLAAGTAFKTASITLEEALIERGYAGHSGEAADLASNLRAADRGPHTR